MTDTPGRLQNVPLKTTAPLSERHVAESHWKVSTKGGPEVDVYRRTDKNGRPSRLCEYGRHDPTDLVLPNLSPACKDTSVSGRHDGTESRFLKFHRDGGTSSKSVTQNLLHVLIVHSGDRNRLDWKKIVKEKIFLFFSFFTV